MTEVWVFGGIGIVVLALIVWAYMRNSARNSERDLFFAMYGFVPCEEDKKELLDHVLSLERNAEYRYSIENPHKTYLNGETVFFYQKHRNRRKQIYAVEEFLFPLRDETCQPLTLYLKPASLGEGMAANLLRSVTGAAWDTQPDDLVRMDPSDLQNEGILNIFGPPEASVFDLLSPDRLNAVARGGDHGILVLRISHGFCSFEFMRECPNADLKKAWSFLQDVMETPQAECRYGAQELATTPV